jgi:hypothetical protein
MGAERGEPRSLVAGAAMSPACLGASGFCSGLVEPVGEDSLGMRRGPEIRNDTPEQRGKLEGPGIFTSLRNMFENEENVMGMDVRPMRLVMEYIPKATVVAGIKTPGQ